MRWGRAKTFSPPRPLQPGEPKPFVVATVPALAVPWSIVGCGPSLDWSAIDPPDPVICLNRAIQGAKRCDYWVCIDSPNPEHSVCVEDARRCMPVVVTQRRRFPKWANWHGLQLRCYGEVPHKTSWVQEQKGGGPRYSMVSAIAFAVERGATELHFFGVDMSGHGYHTGLPEREKRKQTKDHTDRYAERWRKRWEAPRKELDQMRRIWQAASDRGIPMYGLPAHVTGEPCPTP